MSYTYPPTSSQDMTKEKSLYAWLAKKSCMYMSSPMTSGALYLEFESEGPATQSDKTLIWNVNQANAALLFRKVTRKYPLSDLISPFHFQEQSDSRENWTGDDYLVFWADILINKVHTIYFVDNWEYSCGCAYEFLIAMKNGIGTRSSQYREITLQQGIGLIHSALQDYGDNGVCHCFLTEVYKELLRMDFENTMGKELDKCEVCNHG